jgi:hypothetical protein
MLGLIPVAPRNTLVIDPDLPGWLPELSLANIRIGSAQVSLRFRRDRSGYTHHEIIEQQGDLRIHRAATGSSGTDRFARFLLEVG